MERSNRQSYLDWLRVIAISGVLFFHSAMPFVSEWEWHIKNKETSNLLLEFNFTMSRFRMPLLFFISGTVTYFMLQRRSSAQFIGLRFRRLFVPLVFGMLLVVPIQVYMERINQGFKGDFLDFYPSVFTTGPYPKGNLSWHHLWFIAYLFLYDVLFAPLFKWCVQNKHKLGLFDKLSKGTLIYFLMLPSVGYFVATVLRFPETHALIDDWCWIVYWLLFLLAGFICMCVPSLISSLERNRRTSLTFGLLALILLNYLRWNDLEPEKFITSGKGTTWTYLYLSLYPLIAWFCVFAAVGYGKRYLDKKVSAMNYINSAVYPFYILHQTIIVVLAFYVVKTTDSILIKYLFIVLLAFILSMLFYHLFIRPFAVTRFLFGAKIQRDKVHKSDSPVLKSHQIETVA